MSDFEVQFSENKQEVDVDFTDGTRALNGKDGKDGKDGKNGKDGKSAYELAVQKGYEGTEEEWLISLKGEDGEPGLPGIDGKHAYVFTTEGSSTAFTATIEGYTEYTKGDLFVMIPHIAATSTSPKLNINGLGSYSIQRRTYNSTIKALRSSGCIAKGFPQLLIFTGSNFVALSQYQPYGGTDFYTTISVSKGGTGKTSWTANRLIYASGTTTLSQIYPPSSDSVLMQSTSGAPYWKSNTEIVPGMMVYRGKHSDPILLPPLKKGSVYKFTTDVVPEIVSGVSEVSYYLDNETSFYTYEWGIEIYSNVNDICFQELSKILPSDYLNGYCENPFTFAFIQGSNQENAKVYIYHCTQAYTYYNEFEDGSCYYYSFFSGSWENNEYPTENYIASGQYITFRVPSGTYPAGTYICTGTDWELLV